jgi:hypothetical protein
MAPSLPGVLARIELPFRRATEAAGHIRKNVARLWRFDLQYFEGMHRLFERFYESIRNGSPPPISHQRTLRLTSLLDDVIWACDQSSTGSAARPEGLAAIDRAS